MDRKGLFRDCCLNVFLDNGLDQGNSLFLACICPSLLNRELPTHGLLVAVVIIILSQLLSVCCCPILKTAGFNFRNSQIVIVDAALCKNLKHTISQSKLNPSYLQLRSDVCHEAREYFATVILAPNSKHSCGTACLSKRAWPLT